MSNKEFTISTDTTKLNLHLIHDFLSTQSHWAQNRTLRTVEQSIQHSLCFGLYDSNNQQAGFARVITDYAVYAYVLDVFILESFRGKGLSKLLMDFIINYRDLQKVTQWALRTKNAHGLYEKFGFVQVSKPERLMERNVANTTQG